MSTIAELFSLLRDFEQLAGEAKFGGMSGIEVGEKIETLIEEFRESNE